VIVTFTGTRLGMTAEQKFAVQTLLAELGAETVHHGACSGSDRQFHAIAGEFACHRELHPCTEEQKVWADYNASQTDVVHPVDPDAIGRNRRMVDRSQTVISTPSGGKELRRGSGTWATMRYSRLKKRTLYVVWPSGKVSETWQSRYTTGAIV
jgi:hypothetical protein